MKTRRIYLQPNETVEVINQYGTSMLKVTCLFNYEAPVAVTYSQPGVEVLSATAAQSYCLGTTPKERVQPDPACEALTIQQELL